MPRSEHTFDVDDAGTLLLSLLAKQAKFGASLADLHVSLNELIEVVIRIEHRLETNTSNGEELGATTRVHDPDSPPVGPA
jgi:hypothetical protein